MITQKILLVEDSVDDAFLVSRTIDKHLPGHFQVTNKKTMATAETYIRENRDEVSIVLLDLGLPDTKGGRDTFAHMKEYAPEIPIVVLTGLEDHDLALELVRQGAEDFVNKGLVREKPELLRDALEFASCRHQLMDETNKKLQEDLKDKEEVISWMNGDYSVKK